MENDNTPFKILHTSDWHIGATLYGRDRGADHRLMLRQIADIVAEEQPDAVLVSGDIFDTGTPSAASCRLLDEGLMTIVRAGKPGMAVVLTSGNHDSPTRHTAHSAVYSTVGVHTVGSAAITAEADIDALADDMIIPVGGRGYVVAVPYVNPRNMPDGLFGRLLDRVARVNDAGLPVVMMAHLTVADSRYTGHDNSTDGIVGGLESVDIATLGSGYDYLALGHIHCPQQRHVGTAVARYCGTPLAVSFDEAYPHSVTVVEMSTHGEPCRVRTIELPPLHPLVTVGGDRGLPEETLKAELTSVDPDTGAPAIPAGAYIRFNLALPEGVLRPDNTAVPNLARACEDAGYAYCLTQPVLNLRHAGDSDRRILTVDQVRRMDPVDIAADFAAKKGVIWTDELADMLRLTISLAKEDMD